MSRRRRRASSILVDVTPLRLDPAFRRLWIGLIGSAAGKETARLALPLQVYLLTDSAAAIGLLALVQLLATIVFSFGGGAIADAYDRRRVLIISQGGMTAASGGLVAAALGGDPPFLIVLSLAFILAACFAIENPARISAVPRLVGEERITSAVALTALNFQASSVIGPAVAGILIAVAGLPAAYGLQAAAYAWATLQAIRLPAIPAHTPGRRPTLTAVADGLRFVRRRRDILSTFAIDLNAMIFGMPLALIPVLAIDVFGVGAAGAAAMASARGAGAFAAAVLSGWLPRLVAPGRAILWAVTVFCGASAVIALLGEWFALALAVMAVAGASDVISAVLRNSIVQTATPDPVRGRVSALHVLSAGGGPRVGDARAALMAEAVGVQASMVIGGVIALAGVAFVARIFPELARYRPPIHSIHRE
jgi:MFS family permease